MLIQTKAIKILLTILLSAALGGCFGGKGKYEWYHNQFDVQTFLVDEVKCYEASRVKPHRRATTYAPRWVYERCMRGKGYWPANKRRIRF